MDMETRDRLIAADATFQARVAELREADDAERNRRRMHAIARAARRSARDEARQARDEAIRDAHGRGYTTYAIARTMAPHRNVTATVARALGAA